MENNRQHSFKFNNCSWKQLGCFFKKNLFCFILLLVSSRGKFKLKDSTGTIILKIHNANSELRSRGLRRWDAEQTVGSRTSVCRKIKGPWEFLKCCNTTEHFKGKNARKCSVAIPHGKYQPGNGKKNWGFHHHINVNITALHASRQGFAVAAVSSAARAPTRRARRRADAGRAGLGKEERHWQVSKHNCVWVVPLKSLPWRSF